MISLIKLQEKVEKRLSEHIGFDIKKIFELDNFISIYGGAIRDSIADMNINDIDILCSPKSARKLREFLIEKHDYMPVDLHNRNTIDLYKGMSLIADPWTLLSKDRKIVQIIRPRYRGSYRESNREKRKQMFLDAFYSLIKNVDMSNCGVFMDKSDNEIKLKEACKNGIVHCLTKSFEINDWSTLYESNRTLMRQDKLESRGWYCLSKSNRNFFSENDKKQKEREIKLMKLKLKTEYPYKIWTDEEYQNHEIAKPEENDLSFPF